MLKLGSNRSRRYEDPLRSPLTIGSRMYSKIQRSYSLRDKECVGGNLPECQSDE
jgi:hypothetical protein